MFEISQVSGPEDIYKVGHDLDVALSLVWVAGEHARALREDVEDPTEPISKEQVELVMYALNMILTKLEMAAGDVSLIAEKVRDQRASGIKQIG